MAFGNPALNEGVLVAFVRVLPVSVESSVELSAMTNDDGNQFFVVLAADVGAGATAVAEETGSELGADVILGEAEACSDDAGAISDTTEPDEISADPRLDTTEELGTSEGDTKPDVDD